MRNPKILVIVIVVFALSAWWFFDLGSYLQLETPAARHRWSARVVRNNPLLAGLIFFAGYIVVTALSLPGSAVMTLAGRPFSAFGMQCCWCHLPVVSGRLWLSLFRDCC